MSRLARFRPFVYPGILASCLVAWAVALFLQHGLGMQPCSLCILQRWALTAVMVTAGIAWLVESRGRSSRWVAVAPLLCATAGVVVAVKHLVLQMTPREAEGGCGFGGEMLLDSFPLTQALPALFAGSGDCASLPPVLGAPLPLWALVFFLGVTVVMAYELGRSRPKA